MSTTTRLVRKDHLPTTRLETQEDTALADGQVRVRGDSFALTYGRVLAYEAQAQVPADAACVYIVPCSVH